MARADGKELPEQERRSIFLAFGFNSSSISLRTPASTWALAVASRVGPEAFEGE